MVEHLGDGRLFLTRWEFLDLMKRNWVNSGFSPVLRAIESSLTKGIIGLPSAVFRSWGTGESVGLRRMLLRSLSQVKRFFDFRGAKSSESKTLGVSECVCMCGKAGVCVCMCLHA